MRISDWISDVCSSDLRVRQPARDQLQASAQTDARVCRWRAQLHGGTSRTAGNADLHQRVPAAHSELPAQGRLQGRVLRGRRGRPEDTAADLVDDLLLHMDRSEEHTSELQSLLRLSYAVFCLKKKK